jgi:putative transposase
MDSGNCSIKRFAHSVGQNWYHLVLVPKARCSVFKYELTKELAERAIEEVCTRHKIDLFAKEVMPDHVHLFVSCPPDYSVRRLFRIIKGGTSFCIRRDQPVLKKYKSLWNRGMMYRSIGSVSADTVKHYIQNSNSWSRTKQRTL